MTRNNFILLLLLFTFFLAGCNQESASLENNKIAASQTLSIHDPLESGITFSNTIENTESQNIIEYLYFYNGGGIAVGDINGDGLEDIYFTGNQVPDQLYLNKGNLQFEEITEKAGITVQSGWSTGVVMDDVNGDGHLDIYVCKVSKMNPDQGIHNLLYVNDGKGNFSEKSAEYGINFSGYSTQAAFLDYDKDGDLDMYLLNHAVHSVRSYGKSSKRNQSDPVSGDVFYENRIDEGGKFEKVTKKVGIYDSPLGYGLAITTGDFNNDGWTDIYIGNDFHENDYLYLNTGKKSFRESIADAFPHTSQFSMGVDMADINQDGWMDIFSTDMLPYSAKVAMKSAGEDTDQIKRIKEDFGFEDQNARNHMQLNNRRGSFYDVAFQTNTFATDWSWSVLLQDFDNNRLVDVFVCNGIVRRPNDLDYINYINSNKTDIPYQELVDKIPPMPMTNILFVQSDNMSFSPLDSSFLGNPGLSNGAAYSDLDNDGDLEIITNNINETATIYKNSASDQSNYLSFVFDYQKATPKGCKITIVKGQERMVKEFQTTKGFQSSSSHVLHFGLGNWEKVDSAIINWPDFTTQVLENPTINGAIKLNYQPRLDPRDPYPVPNFVEYQSPLVFPVKHQENNYYDEDQEKLVPERFSSEGPAFITEDLNGDGIDDLFIGGARGQEANLLLGNKSASYDRKLLADLQSDARYEDVDASAIDFDGDGDLDIYVASGGNDYPELNKVLEDRIYLNNNNGEFRRIPLSLPHTNGSKVSVADFDQDGWQDIFVGASTIPGSYGLSPYSFVLRNNNGQAVEIAFKERLGMVKDGKWVDLDGDQYPELIVCGHWMPIRIFSYKGGEFVEQTAEYGLEGISGLWNTIEFSDVDLDGDLDMLAGNAGTNSKWTSGENPALELYVGDFDQNGSSDPIIFYNYFGRKMPFASLDKLATQIPGIKKTFRTYEQFSQVTSIDDLFEKADEFIIESKFVNEVRSTIFIREENRFLPVPMGLEEQRSAINDFYINSNREIWYTGNNEAYVAELGKGSGNPGRILSEFDSERKRFKYSKRLPLPLDIAGKGIGRANGKMIIFTHNNYPYILE